MRYALAARNPTGGKVERIPCGAGRAAPAERTGPLADAQSVKLRTRQVGRAKSDAAQGEDE